MLETAEALRLILLALALGVTVPVLIQLFLTLRQVRQTIGRLSDQIEPSLQLFNEIAQKPREVLHAPSSSIASIVASVIPAAVAAYRAFRQHQAEEEAQEAAEKSGSLEINLEMNRGEEHAPSGY
jgi:biopolymer transport protein ExbB/TolQ